MRGEREEMWECGSMGMRKRGNEKVRKCCISAFSHFLIFALSYFHILTLHSASLPTGYTQLDKLEFNGGQWIETDYCPAAGDRFECEVTVADVQLNATAAVFGTVREGEPERTFAFYVRQDGDDSTVVAYGDMACGGFFPRGKKVTLSVGPDGATWTWEGGSGRIELMTPGFARDGVTPLLIGDANAARFVGGSVPAGTGAAMTLHRFRIWRGGLELLHDYEPCRNPSGEIGLYDALEKDENARFKRLEPQPHPDPQTEKVSEEGRAGSEGGDPKVIGFVFDSEDKFPGWLITVTGVLWNVEYVLEGSSSPTMSNSEVESMGTGDESGVMTLKTRPPTKTDSARFYRVKEK